MKNKRPYFRVKPLTDEEILEIADSDTSYSDMPYEGDTSRYFCATFSLDVPQISKQYDGQERVVDEWEDSLLKGASVESSYRRLTEVMASGLSPREEFCLRSAYMQHDERIDGFQSAAKRLGYTQERVRMIVDKAIRKLKHPYRAKYILGEKRKLVL